MSSSYNFTEKLEPLMRRAGKMILAAHDQESADHLQMKPGTANFVTTYDVAVQEYLISNIRSIYPQAVFIAEENEMGENSALLDKELCFIIDPIDGTTNFVHDYRNSVISVGIVSQRKTIYGAAFHPYQNEFCCAAPGEGTLLNGHPVHVSERTVDMSLAAIGTGVYYKDKLGKKTMALANDLYFSCVDIRRTGSAVIDLMNLACGRVDIFAEYLLQPWDMAAGVLMVTEAGGIVTDMLGAPITLDGPSSLVAGNPITYPEAFKKAAKYY